MSVDLLEMPVAKRNDVTTRIDREVLEEVVLAAAYCKMSVPEYLSARMAEAARRDIEEGIAKRMKEKRKGPQS